MDNITFVKGNLDVSTSGLASRGMLELRVAVETISLLPECEEFLRFVVDYLQNTGRTIKPGETLNYGYWLVKFQTTDEDYLDVWEYDSEGSQFVRGGSLALSYWRDQHQICREYRAEFKPPRPDRLTAVSAGVLEGLPVQGVRYPWQEQMSGWLLVTPQWDNDVRSLTNHHTYHITSKRPDLARFLALPIGFRFDLIGRQKVWLDQEVATQAPISRNK